MVSPEEEAELSYLTIDYYHIGRIMFTVSTCLTISGLYFSATPHYVPEDYFSNQTKWVLENYETRPNGSMYFSYVQEDGTVAYGELGDWFVRMLGGEIRFPFGNSFWNYCRLRDVPTTDWMTSIARSMNHLVLVQVFFRSAVLLTITHSLFQCLLIKNLAEVERDSAAVRYLLGFPLIVVEFVHNISLFFISCIQYEQDAHMVPLNRLSIVFLTITTVLKLLFSAIQVPNQYLKTICILMSSIIILSHNTVIGDYESFLADQFCDSSSPPIVVLSQLSYFLAFFICGYIQNKSMKNVQLICCTAQEELDYERRFCVGEFKLFSG